MIYFIYLNYFTFIIAFRNLFYALFSILLLYSILYLIFFSVLIYFPFSIHSSIFLVSIWWDCKSRKLVFENLCWQ